jgi:hypothetical protein
MIWVRKFSGADFLMIKVKRLKSWNVPQSIVKLLKSNDLAELAILLPSSR